jgi:hypothetical protein
MKYIISSKLNGGRLEIWSTGRGGTKSPTSFYYRFEGRFVSPFEQRVRVWPNIHGVLINSVLRKVYKPYLKDLIYQDNPFLARLDIRR